MIEFILNNEIVRTELSPGMTLLDFVRYEANLRGTKIGCREGDCGACTVLLGEFKEQKLQYFSATSCLTPLANVHGMHVVTIEGLNTEGLNVVQQAFVDCSGTQCGFCTPGFVTSLSGYALNCENANTVSAIGSMDGNICRCTGYKSIERAAAIVAEKLQEKDQNLALKWLTDKDFIPAYFESIPEKLRQLSEIPVVAGETAIGGGTDLFVHHQDKLQEGSLNFLFRKKELSGIEFTDTECIINASSTATDLIENKRLQSIFPGWHSFMKLVSSTPIRNIGTVAGNLVNASPIGDLTIILLGLNARIVLAENDQQSRNLQLSDFYLDYKKLDKKESEIISQIRFDLPAKDSRFHFEKVCKRKYLDIASVNTAIQIRLNDENKIFEIHCSMGGVGPVPKYLKNTIEFLRDKELSPKLIRESVEILLTEISPIGDARGSAEYKRLLARQLYFSHFHTMFPEVIKLEDLL
jgi:xanthine dehydrogenase small subunit